MNTVGKDDIRRLVKVFYQNPFKTFYINSTDGETFIKPVGVFVSLGITTSLGTLENIKDIIENSEYYSARLVEIGSKKVSGQFLNYITSEDPKQIHINTIQEGLQLLKTLKTEGVSQIMDQTASIIELEKMKDRLHPDQDIKTIQDYAPKITSLETLINQINDDPLGWDGYWILKRQDGTFKLFHRYINYGNMGDIEYRIGIFVTPK